MPPRSNYRMLKETSFTKENFGGAFSLQGALKTPKYGNYNVINEMANEDAGIQNAGIRMPKSDNNCSGEGCSSCPKKYNGEIKRFYSGVL